MEICFLGNGPSRRHSGRILGVFVTLGSNTGGINIKEMIILSMIAGFTGNLLAQLILPAFVSSFAGTFESMALLNVANLISWSAILITITGISFALVIVQKKDQLNLSFAFLTLALCAVFSCFLLCVGSYIYLLYTAPEILQDVAITTKIVKFYSYPTLVSLTLENPEPIWMISTILFLLIYNLSYVYMGKR